MPNRTDSPPVEPAFRPVLRWRITSTLLLVSLLPLGVLGIGAYLVFGRMLEAKALELQRSTVEKHAGSIDSYLLGRRRALRLLAAASSLDRLRAPGALEMALADLNRTMDGGFVDLGVIDASGEHLAYVGPYDLSRRNYAEATWFREAIEQGIATSDVFLGYRGVPHCILAVRAGDADTPWLLRATIDSEQFDRLVRTGSLGAGADAFLLDREGIYQTRPGVGEVLTRAPFAIPTDRTGVHDSRVDVGGRTMILVTTAVNDGRWALVVLQGSAEVRAPVTRATVVGGSFVLGAFLLVVLATVLATRYLTGRIEIANRRRDEMVKAFQRSARLASIGELATGLAHEINNPLAIISAQLTNVRDATGDLPASTPGRDVILETLGRAQRQVQRCGGITGRMLQFGRQQDGTPVFTDLGPRLTEVVALLDRQARVRDVTLAVEVPPGLPPVRLDPVGLEQVLVNLIKNSLDAMPDGGTVLLRAFPDGDEVRLEVRDDGPGIPPEVLPRIFEPFFTTKPVGQGTGLGLSVCYGIVSAWGGTIEAESPPEGGTVMRMRLPTGTHVPSRCSAEEAEP